jgi:hypothetical protein
MVSILNKIYSSRLIMEVKKFLGHFTLHYVEDENAQIPLPCQHLILHIPLETRVENETLILQGRRSPFKAQCCNITLNNHSHGMYFDVTCCNSDERYKDKVLWRRFVDRAFLREIFIHSQEGIKLISLEGDAPEIANAQITTAELTCSRKKHDYHLDEVKLRMDLDIFQSFVKRYEEGSCGQGAPSNPL